MKDLNLEVKKKTREIDVTWYPIPISTLAEWYRKGKIVLKPDFQRVYRWDKKQKSEFIESILLRLPIPSIFFAINEWGDKWEVVDWQQRLSTIFEFMWLLNTDNKNSISDWVEGTEYLPSLQWKTFRKLSSELQIDFESTWLDCKMIRKDSNPDVKFEIFKRLNKGGAKLTEQEVRSCIIIMTNPNFYYYLEQLAKYESFKNFYSFSEKQLAEQFDKELALRFLVLIKWDDDQWFKNWISDLLDNKAKKFSLIYNNNIEDFKKIKEVFKQTFDLLIKCWGDELIQSEKSRKSIPLFDIIAWWIWYNLCVGNIDLLNQTLKDRIISKIEILKKDEEVKEILKPWKNSIDKIKDTFILWKKYFNLW